jgi:hypothetical protein
VDEEIHRFLDRTTQMLAGLWLWDIREGRLVAFRPQWTVHRCLASVWAGINPAVVADAGHKPPAGSRAERVLY